MKVLFKAVLIYGIASAVVAWFGLLFITIANLVFAFARSISMGVNIFQNFAAGVILVLLTILLFWGMKLLFGVAKAGMAMGKAMASAGKMGMPPGGMGNMLKGLGKLDPRSLRDAGNLANRLGSRKTGNLLNKGANMKSGLDEARELKAIAGEKNTGKIDKKKKKELEKSRSKRTADLDKASKSKKSRDEIKAGMLLDEDGNKKTGEELRDAEKEAQKFDEDAQRVAKFRNLFPELGERLDSDQISRLLDDEMPNYEKRRLGIGDDEMNKITARAEKGHFTDGLGVNTDNHYKKLADEIGGIGEEHKDVVATDDKEIQEKNSETRENDEKATSTADSLKDAHSSEVEANESLAGEELTQKALNVSQTVNETKNATLNGSDNANSPEAVISDPDKEREIASGANDLPVDKSTAEDNARRTSVEIDNLTSSAPGMPEGTTLDENGDSLRSNLLNRDEEGNVISSVEDDEIVRSGETAARGDAIHGTVLPKEVTDSGDFSEENITKATSSATQDYVNGMEDKAVADSLTEKDLLGSTSASDSDNVSEYTGEKTGQTVGTKNNVEDIISSETTSTASSDDYMATLEDTERETVGANRTASTDTQFAEKMSTERPMDVRDDQTSSVNDVIGQPVDDNTVSDRTEARTGVSDRTEARTGISESNIDSVIGEPVSDSNVENKVTERTSSTQSPESVIGEPVSDSNVEDKVTERTSSTQSPESVIGEPVSDNTVTDRMSSATNESVMDQPVSGSATSGSNSTRATDANNVESFGEGTNNVESFTEGTNNVESFGEGTNNVESFTEGTNNIGMENNDVLSSLEDNQGEPVQATPEKMDAVQRSFHKLQEAREHHEQEVREGRGYTGDSTGWYNAKPRKETNDTVTPVGQSESFGQPSADNQDNNVSNADQMAQAASSTDNLVGAVPSSNEDKVTPVSDQNVSRNDQTTVNAPNINQDANANNVDQFTGVTSSNQDSVESSNDQGISNVDQFIGGTSSTQETTSNVPNVDQFIGNTPNEDNAVPVSNQQSQSVPNVDQFTGGVSSPNQETAPSVSENQSQSVPNVDQFTGGTSTSDQNTFGSQQSQGVPSVDQFITDTSTPDTAAASNTDQFVGSSPVTNQGENTPRTDQFVGSDSARNQETTTPVSQVNNASNVNQSAQPVSDAQQDSTPVEQSNNVEAPVDNQATAPVSDQRVDATDTDKFTDAGTSVPFTQDNSNTTGQNTEQPVQSENNVSQFTEPQSAPGVSNQDIFGAVNQETPDYVERPTQAQPQQAQSDPVEPQQSNEPVYGESPVQDQNYQDRPAQSQFTENTQQTSGMNQDQFTASGQQSSEPGFIPAPAQPQQDTGYVQQDRPAPAQGEQSYNAPTPEPMDQTVPTQGQGEQGYSNAPQQDTGYVQQDRPAPAQFVEDTQQPSGMNQDQFTASGQHSSDQSYQDRPAPAQGEQGYGNAPQQDQGYGNAPQQDQGYQDRPAPVQGEQSYQNAPQQDQGYQNAPQQDQGYQDRPAPAQGEQSYHNAPQQDQGYQDRPAPAQFVEDTKKPSGMNQDQFTASGQQYSEQGYNNAPQQDQNYQDRPAPAQQAPMSTDPQQYMGNSSTQQPSNDDIMDSLVGEPQPQPTRETPVTPVNYVNGQADNVQPTSGDYGNIPFIGDNGFYGDRDVKLSPESLALMGMMMGEKENSRDSDLRKDINDMNRRTENRMVDRMDKLSEKFAEDLRESGKYTDDEITNEIDKVENALRESMKRTDSFLEDLDKSKIDGNLTNQGNTGKVKRPKKD